MVLHKPHLTFGLPATMESPGKMQLDTNCPYCHVSYKLSGIINSQFFPVLLVAVC